VPQPINILHEDDAVVIVDKPAGLAVHRSHLVGADDEYLVDRVREQTGRILYLAHRLDRATSGALVFAAGKDVAASLGAQFMQREVDKTYLGVCRGWPDPEGTIDYPLDAPGQREAKPALTRWRTLATATLGVPMGRYPEQRYALLELAPETGRYQQIRRHLHHVSHHLIGDTTHGRGDHNRLFRIHLGVHRLLLHAWRIGFAHPVDGRWLRVAAPVDAAWQRVFERFGWGLPEGDAAAPSQ
jgi:tRNA pseudouridine65 synthase